MRVLEIDERIVGYGDVAVANGVVVLEVAAPDYWDHFLAWAEDTAREANASRVRVLSYSGEALPRAAASRGYFLWRSNYTMGIEFAVAGRPAASPMPSGIEARQYRPDDLDCLRDAINEVFLHDPFFVRLTAERFREDYLHAPGMEPEFWMLAWDDEELAGFSLGFAAWHGVDGVGEVKSVGVRPKWRHRGMGEALVRSTLRQLHIHGLQRVMLGVDALNETEAVRLYERVGMRIAQQADNWALDL